MFHHLPADISQAELEKLIKSLNDDQTINGILVQLPLPSYLNEERVLQLISVEKDVDGLSPINIGRLAQKDANRCSFLARRMAVSICWIKWEFKSKAPMQWCLDVPTLLVCLLHCCW